ncbi:hypothetical protein VSDG_01858 [Cytospora chrysosperma]|uniref:Uncharacterized protein n=1 Tax=Cytospora chrysosperma TaxID=252740 RepID=A0A423WH27_CYTCH|nr:hypothetical protein VSDG_01858 [Valsa sordida]
MEIQYSVHCRQAEEETTKMCPIIIIITTTTTTIIIIITLRVISRAQPGISSPAHAEKGFPTIVKAGI